MIYNKKQQISTILSIFLISLTASTFNIAHAAKSTGIFKTSAVLNGSCDFNVTNINFGNINTSSPSYQFSSGNVAIKCSRLITFTLGLGSGSSGDLVNRTMTKNGSSSLLGYNISRNANNTTSTGVWGNDDNNAHQYYRSGGTGQLNTVTMYGYVKPNQFIEPGNYSDTLVMTVNF